MERTRRIAAALVALTLAAAGTVAVAAGEPAPRVLSVGGEGEVRVAPDRADVSLTVEASEKTLAAAERQVGEGVARLLKLCDSLGIPRAQVRSAQLAVNPQYDSGSLLSGRPRIVGYGVSRRLEVDLRDLSSLGRLLQGAVENGANRIAGPVFGSSKKDEHQRAALALAAQDARANAEVLAKTLGVKLGRLHSLTASGSDGPPPRPMMAMRAEMKSMSAADQTYEPGEIVFHATVTAEFDLPP